MCEYIHDREQNRNWILKGVIVAYPPGVRGRRTDAAGRRRASAIKSWREQGCQREIQFSCSLSHTRNNVVMSCVERPKRKAKHTPR